MGPNARRVPLAVAAAVVALLGLSGCRSATEASNAPLTDSPAVSDATLPSTVTTVAPTPDSAPPGPGGTVPNVTGNELDQAEGTLLSDGFGYKVYGGGDFGVVVTSNWTVCSQNPAAGKSATAVNLVVARNCT